MSSIINKKPFSNPKNINLKLGLLRFGMTQSSNPYGTTDNGLYTNSSNQLVYVSQGSATVVGGSGSGAVPSWETLYTNDNTFALTTGTFTVAGAGLTTDVLTLTADAGTSGDVIQITNSGTGKDIQGTSNTWNVTAAGVATNVGQVLTGTSNALSSTGAAVWTIKDNDSASLSIDASGSTGLMLFDTTNGAEKITATVRGFTVIGNSNTVQTLLITNNTATTFGANADSSGVVVIRSSSLTTGSLLQLQTTEATLNGGFYLTARDVTGPANVFTIGEDGVVVMAGTAASNSFTMTAGDMVMSDGSITMTDADDAATLSITNNTAATASMVVIAGSGTFTGTTTTSFMTITPSGLTSGTAVYLPVAAMTTGTALSIVAATANFTTGGKLISLDSTAAVAGNLISAVTTGAYTGTGMLIMSAGAMTTGVMVSLASTTGLTTGSLIRATSSTAGAIATNGAISVRATGAFTSTANVGYVDILASATTLGTVVRIASSAAAQTATELLRVVASGFTTGFTGSVVNFISSSTTGTGTVLNISSANTTAGTAMTITANGLTTGSAVLVTSSGTITSSAEGMVNFVGTGITTGDALKIDLTEGTLTTGHYINCFDDTGTVSVFSVGKTGTLLHRDFTEVVTATNVITASESGSVYFLNSATEFVSTLPAPAAGLHFTFIVSAAPSGASYTVVTNASANVIKGTVHSSTGGNADSHASADTITFVDGVSIAGDTAIVWSDGTSWFAKCFCDADAGITVTQAS
jgi:hypothetical protein